MTTQLESEFDLLKKQINAKLSSAKMLVDQANELAKNAGVTIADTTDTYEYVFSEYPKLSESFSVASLNQLFSSGNWSSSSEDWSSSNCEI